MKKKFTEEQIAFALKQAEPRPLLSFIAKSTVPQKSPSSRFVGVLVNQEVI